jgi:CheY-like chemotaxis protein
MSEVVRELENVRAAANLADDEFAVGPPAAPAEPTGRHQQTVALDPGQAAPAGAPAGPLAGGAAVVAEPSRTQAGIIRNYIQRLGAAAVHAVGSGREAIEAVKQTGARVVVSSLHLSDMTGAQLAAALRSDPACAGVGFVLATGESDPEATAGLPRDAQTVVMPKPFDLDRLARAVASVVG